MGTKVRSESLLSCVQILHYYESNFRLNCSVFTLDFYRYTANNAMHRRNAPHRSKKLKHTGKGGQTVKRVSSLGGRLKMRLIFSC